MLMRARCGVGDDLAGDELASKILQLAHRTVNTVDMRDI